MTKDKPNPREEFTEKFVIKHIPNSFGYVVHPDDVFDWFKLKTSQALTIQEQEVRARVLGEAKKAVDNSVIHPSANKEIIKMELDSLKTKA